MKETKIVVALSLAIVAKGK